MNFDAAILNGDVRISVVVCDSSGDLMLAMEHHFLLTGSVDL